MPPEATLRMDATTLHVLGTLQGFVPDAARVAAALEQGPDMVALGVPPEDLEALEALHKDPDLAQDLPEADEWSARLLEHLSRFGETRIPSPDLEAAYAGAKARDLPVVPLDLDDLAHTDAHTRRLGLRHIVAMNRRRNRLLKAEMQADDPYALAQDWDAQEHAGALRQVQEEREQHMARRLVEVAKERPGGRILALVPAPRFAGVVARLQATAG